MPYRNLSEMHRLQAERLGPRIAVRFKKHGLYRDLSWDEYRGHVEACAAGLVELGIRPGDRVGLLSENRLEWLIADLGILAAAAVNVPLHSPLTARQIHFQLQDSGARWLFVSNFSQLEKVQQIQKELPTLEGVVVFDVASTTQEILGWEGWLQKGRLARERQLMELKKREDRLGPDDLATIIYTSGTTGNPKGVMLTHGNLLSNTHAMFQASKPPADSIFFNWLPLSHIYARTVDHYMSLVAEVPLCLAESADTVLKNLAEVQPSHMSSVPRFYERVLAAVSTSDKEETARRLHAIFGPRVDWLGSGGAPLPPAIAQAFQDAGLLVLQGYGLTETSPVISFNRKGQFKLASVGQPVPGVEVKVAPDGEILTRGPHVMKGYWNNPQASAETIDKEGWLHTGDLGSLDEENFLTITGRKKELLVLSNGKKVVPTFLEGLLLADPCIDQAVIFGEGRKFLSALIVPNWLNLRRALQAEKIDSDGSEGTLCQDASVLAYLKTQIDKALADVAPWEHVKKFVVLPQPFSVANDEMTVSLKLRRQVIWNRYREALEGLYHD